MSLMQHHYGMFHGIIHSMVYVCCRTYTTPRNIKGGIFWFFLLMYLIQHCFICRPSDSTVSEDACMDRAQDCCDFGSDSQTL
jgi:hypothetical protein